LSDPVAAIQEFVTLSILRHRGELPQDDRWRLETLEDVLRDLIEGARPAPRRIENPSAVTGSQGSGPNVEPAKLVVSRSAPGSQPAPQIAPAVVLSREDLELLDIDMDAPVEAAPPIRLSDSDLAKVSEVGSNEVPPSSYTPSVAPCYLEDYYTTNLELLACAPPDAPSSVRSAGGENLELLQEARMLLGLENADQRKPARAVVTRSASGVAPPAPVVAPAVPSYAPPPATPTTAPGPGQGTPATVHLIAGGFRRGDLIGFEPPAGAIAIRTPQGAQTFPLNQVLAVFFGLARGAEPTPASAGHNLIVKLVNDRELTGVSPDYAPGVVAITLLPHDRRGNTDRIWVPAWAVKEIHFA
jgi:hypothetical protein